MRPATLLSVLLGTAFLASASTVRAQVPKTAVPKSAQEMEVLNVVAEPGSGTPVVLLRGKADGRALAMAIDPTAAVAIMLPLKKVVPPRPYTHDLLNTFIRRAGYSLERVVITDVRNGAYIAAIFVKGGDRPIELDARPSDAIALALRAGVPILAEESVLLKAPTGGEKRL